MMSLLMTAGMNDPLFHGRDDACSCFVRNANESD
jgi:hypothetical protein